MDVSPRQVCKHQAELLAACGEVANFLGVLWWGVALVTRFPSCVVSKMVVLDSCSLVSCSKQAQAGR